MITDYKGMQKHYWRRQRGLANSRSVERLYFCWRERLPKKHAFREVVWKPPLRGSHFQGTRRAPKRLYLCVQNHA